MATTRSNVITLVDVVPAIASCEGEDLPGLVALTGLPPEALGGVPADLLVREGIVGGRLVPPLTAALASDLMATDRFSRVALGSLLPDLPRCANEPGPDVPSDELEEVIGRPVRQWSDLDGIRLRDLLGAVSDASGAEAVLAWTIREAAAVGLRLALPGGPLARKVDASLRLLASWGLGEMRLTRYEELWDALEREPVRPSEIDEAWERVRKAGLTEFGGVLIEQFDLLAALRRLLDFTPRELLVVESRIYPGSSRRTLDDLGTELNVSRERIRQIEDQLKKKVASLLASDDLGVVKRAAERLKREVGACVRVEGAPEQVRWALGWTDAPSPEHRLHARVLASLAGPFELREPWILRAPSSELESLTRDRILEMVEDGPIPVDEANAALAEVGVPASEHAQWLREMCRCREIDGLVVAWTGSLADKAVRILELRGEPLSPEELAHAIGPDTNLRSLTGQIQGDPRFLRRGLKLYGLSLWGGEEYTTIQDEIAQEIERQGGAASMQHLVETLCAQFGVAASSVRAYASDPPFVRSATGLVAVANAEVRVVWTPIEDTRGCFRVGTHWSLRVLVDGEILRGSGRSIPPGVLQHLGMRPQDRRYLSTPVGDLLVNYGRQATIGSLRRAAQSLDCVEGDLLFVVLASDGAAEFRAVRRDRLDKLEGMERLAAEVGAAEAEEPIAAVSYALGLPSDEYRLDAVRRRLRARKETDLLAFVPADRDHTSDEDILQDLLGDL